MNKPIHADLIERLKLAHVHWATNLTATIRKNKGSPKYIWLYRKQLLTLQIVTTRGKIISREWLEDHTS